MKYLQLLTFLFANGCAKKSVQNSAEKHFEGQTNCLTPLQENMRKAECPKLSFRHLGPHDIMIRCVKDDADRGEFWDNYIFRISSAKLVYSPEDQALIDKHTLCIDAGIRVEAYPPEGIK